MYAKPRMEIVPITHQGRFGLAKSDTAIRRDKQGPINRLAPRPTGKNRMFIYSSRFTTLKLWNRHEKKARLPRFSRRVENPADKLLIYAPVMICDDLLIGLIIPSLRSTSDHHSTQGVCPCKVTFTPILTD